MIPLEEAQYQYTLAARRLLDALKAFGPAAAGDMCKFFRGDPARVGDFMVLWPDYVHQWLGEFFESLNAGGKIKVPEISMAEIIEEFDRAEKERVARDKAL